VQTWPENQLPATLVAADTIPILTDADTANGRMKKATLIYNPNSGRRHQKVELQQALSVLHSSNVEAEIIVTQSSQEATDRARQAVVWGADTVFACGGDGTINDVIQGLAGTNAALAVIPTGTANALAHDLGIPMHPRAAVLAALQGKVRRVALGRVEYQNFSGQSASRYFTVAAGIGVDAHLFYKLTTTLKKRSGMTAYYLKAWQLWATHRMRKFEVEYSDVSGSRQRALLTELLAVRIRFFGNILRELVPGASLDCLDLRTVMCRTSERNAYLRYVTGAVLGRKWSVDGIDLVNCAEILCRQPVGGEGASDERVFVEADGELLGKLPARLNMVPDALSLVVPAQLGV
jgi:diacylglycerol kinase (ATP)